LDLKRDKKARELAIADNRVGEIDLEWNPEALASLDVDLKQFWNENELNALLGDFRSSELSAPEPKIDQAAELQKKWKTKRGQVWTIGQHRLMCGDSTSASDVAALVDGKSAALRYRSAILGILRCEEPPFQEFLRRQEQGLEGALRRQAEIRTSWPVL
jgi:hypothetical protein